MKTEPALPTKKSKVFFRAYVITSLIVAGLFVVLLISAVIYAQRLPHQVQGERSTVFSESPNVLWSKLREVNQFPQWRKSLQAVQVLESDSNGAIRWTELRPGDQATVTVFDQAIPYSLTLDIVTSQNVTSTRWTFVLKPITPDSTLVTLRTTIDLRDPIFRIFARWILDPIQPLEQFLEQLHTALKS